MQTIYNLRCKIADHIGDEPEAPKWVETCGAPPSATKTATAPATTRPARPSCSPAGVSGTTQYRPVASTVLQRRAGLRRAAGGGALVAVLMTFLRAGSPRGGGEGARAGLPKPRHERDAFSFLPDHLRFCVLTGNVDRAVDILAEHLSWLDRPYDDVFDGFAAAGTLCAGWPPRPDVPSTGRRSRSRAEADLARSF